MTARFSAISSAASLGRLTLTLAAFAAAGSLTAQAAPEAPNSQRVDLSDLDLTRPTGMDTAHRRLVRAIRTVCDDQPGRVTLDERMAIRACKTETMKRAERDLAELETRARYFAGETNGAADILLFHSSARD